MVVSGERGAFKSGGKCMKLQSPFLGKVWVPSSTLIDSNTSLTISQLPDIQAKSHNLSQRTESLTVPFPTTDTSNESVLLP